MGYCHKSVDLRSRACMAEFLASHFRYHVYNSWNNSTSYANCIKIHRLGLTRAQQDKAYDILETHYWPYLKHFLEDFAHENPGYGIYVNGRSGGYLVLVDSGRGIDHGCTSPEIYMDTTDYPITYLRERVRLVTSFDRVTDGIRRAFINLIDNYLVEDCETIKISTNKILVPISA